MANRQKFTRAIKVEIIKRAADMFGAPHCEFILDDGRRCPCTKGLEVHHVDMDAMRPDATKRARKLTTADGMLLCPEHHDPITKQQVSDLSKAKRQEAAHLGAKPEPDKKIISRGFAKVSRNDKKGPLRVANGVGPALMRRGFVPATEVEHD